MKTLVETLMLRPVIPGLAKVAPSRVSVGEIPLGAVSIEIDLPSIINRA